MTAAEMRKLARTSFEAKQTESSNVTFVTNRNEGTSHPKGRDITKNSEPKAWNKFESED